MTEFRYAKGRIMESLEYISREMEEFDTDYAARPWQEYRQDSKLQKLIDRTLENILTALIEVSGVVLSENSVMPDNYQDVMRKVGGFFGFDESEGDTLSKLALQRNRLAHRYLNFRWQAAKFYKENRTTVRKLVKVLYEYEKGKNLALPDL